MDPFAITITDAGIAAMVDAESGSFDPVTIAEIGLTNATFVVAPTLTGLPGEFKRISTVAGLPADDRTLHVMLRDGSDDAYAFTGFGIYLADGTLFGVYAQETAIAEKPAVAALLIAVDIRLDPGQAELFAFGDTNFINPPATEDTAGVAEIATLAEVEAGTDDTRFVTPAKIAQVYAALALLGENNGIATLGPDGKLAVDQRPPLDLIDVFAVANQAAMLALAATPGDFAVRADNGLVYVLQQAPASTLGNWLEINTPAPVMSVNGKVGAVVLTPADIGSPPNARTVTGGGLVTGGGDLSANRVLTVAIATAAEALAGAINDKALTPASLAQVLDAIAARVTTARTVTGGGLVTGGGDLSANRTLTVAKATPAEIQAGTEDGKAITPAGLAGLPKDWSLNGYEYLPGGKLRQWGTFTITINQTLDVVLPITFPNACLNAWCSGGRIFNNSQDNNPEVVAWASNKITIFNAQQVTISGRWVAEGY